MKAANWDIFTDAATTVDGSQDECMGNALQCAGLESRGFGTASGGEYDVFTTGGMSRDTNASLPFNNYFGGVDFGGLEISISATFNRHIPVMESLIVDISGTTAFAAGGVPYEMVGHELRIGDESLLPEAYTNMNPVLEYDPNDNVIKFTVGGYGYLTVTMWSRFFA
ncbi:hypothetical protein FOZ60_015563 [Perkinsus olseni]|uniref:Uncharacterized protein n=1 Tax=Perkinsus olseni TaxID=32597 RepID=A0A7J6P6P1_PEROL|nr:hypothetical protein FOZ60_015563 [Perkinsus olseni]